MYEESNKKFFNSSLLVLILKLICLGIFIFILCWLFLRKTEKVEKKSEEKNNVTAYTSNITAMKDAAKEYFTKEKLPNQTGKSTTITLQEMLDEKLIIDFTNNGTICDNNNSYATATKLGDNNYSLKINLDCNEKSDFIITTIEKEDVVCPSCPVTENKPVADNTTTNNNNNNNNVPTNTTQNTNTNNSTPKKEVTNKNNSSTNSKPVKKVTKKYYEVYQYSDWIDGLDTSGNVLNHCDNEKTFKYCKTGFNNYFGSAILRDAGTFTSFTTDFKLDGVVYEDVTPLYAIADYYSAALDYQNYVNRNRTLINDATKMAKASLNKADYTIDIAGFKSRANNYYAIVNLKYNDGYKNNKTPYYAESMKEKILFAPFKFRVYFIINDSCVRDLASNQSKYAGYLKAEEQNKQICKHKNKTTKWVIESELNNYLNNGWTKTGQVKEQTV